MCPVVPFSMQQPEKSLPSHRPYVLVWHVADGVSFFASLASFGEIATVGSGSGEGSSSGEGGAAVGRHWE